MKVHFIFWSSAWMFDHDAFSVESFWRLLMPNILAGIRRSEVFFMLDCVERWLCYVVHLHFLKYFSCKIIYACCKVSPSKMISLQANPDFWQIRSHLACSDLCLVLVNTHFHLDTQPVPRLSRKTHSSVVIQNIKFCGVLFASCFQDFQFCSVNLDSS